MHPSPHRALAAVGLLAAFLFLSTAPVSAEPGMRVRFGPEQAYAPFIFDDEDGRPAGLSVDILLAIEPALGVSLQWQPSRPLDDILKAARRGEVDLISSLRPTPERAAYLGFTAPYVNVPAVLLWRRGGPGPDAAAHAGHRVAVGQGYAVEAHVRARYPQVVWVPVSDDAQGLALLRRGEVSGLVADIGSLVHLRRRAVEPGGAADLILGEPVGFEYPLAFAWRRDQPELGRRLEQALRDLDPARRREIVRRWLDPEALEFRDPNRGGWQRAALWGLALAAVSALGLRLGQRRRGRRRERRA